MYRILNLPMTRYTYSIAYLLSTDRCDARLNGHCYRIKNQAMSKNEALLFCQMRNGSVVEIESMEENKVVHDVLQANGIYQ